MENMSTIFSFCSDCFLKVLFFPKGEHVPFMLNLSKVKGFSHSYLTGYQKIRFDNPSRMPQCMGDLF